MSVTSQFYVKKIGFRSDLLFLNIYAYLLNQTIYGQQTSSFLKGGEGEGGLVKPGTLSLVSVVKAYSLLTFSLLQLQASFCDSDTEHGR